MFSYMLEIWLGGQLKQMQLYFSSEKWKINLIIQFKQRNVLPHRCQKSKCLENLLFGKISSKTF